MKLSKNTDVYFPPPELLNESLTSVLVKPLLEWVSNNSKELVLILLGVTSSYAKKKCPFLFKEIHAGVSGVYDLLVKN